MDADLSEVSVGWLGNWVDALSKKSTHVVVNQHRPDQGKTLEVYRRRNHLLSDLMNQARSGRRCYVVSNSKKEIDKISKAISIELPEVKTLTITADTVEISRSEVGEFIRNPLVEALQYQLILSSPSLSSGVDLTFPGKVPFYDFVYGVFEYGSTNHFECDQQLARVRNPGETKVYISPLTMDLEDNPDVIIGDLERADAFAYLTSDFDAVSRSIPDDPLFHLTVSLEARKRASKNDLKGNFLRYKKQLGFEIAYTEDDADSAEAGRRWAKAGSDGTALDRISRLLNAQPLSKEELINLISRKQVGEKLGADEIARYRRARIECFYRTPIFGELVDLDHKMRLMEKVRRFEALASGEEIFAKSARQQQVITAIQSEAQKRIFLYRAFKAAGVMDDSGFISDVIISDAKLSDFVTWMNRTRGTYELQFGRNLRADLESSPMLQLGDLLKHVYLKTEKRGTQSTNQKKIYTYSLHQERLRGMHSLRRRRLKIPTNWPEIDFDEDR